MPANAETEWTPKSLTDSQAAGVISACTAGDVHELEKYERQSVDYVHDDTRQLH